MRLDDAVVVTKRRMFNNGVVCLATGIAFGMAVIMSVPKSAGDVVAGTILFGFMLVMVYQLARHGVRQ